MNILSHRGYWKTKAEKNMTAAFMRSFDLCFGTETDVRDHDGELVISHDIPTGDEITLRTFLSLLSKQPLPLALNIKSDGLAPALNKMMCDYPIEQWFVFDMSVPDMMSHLACGNPVYARVSEEEQQPACLHQVKGIWLDAFYDDEWRLASIASYLHLNKKVCVVSPELHGRDPHAFWQALKEQSYLSHTGLSLCTDYPEEAQSFFRTVS